MNAVDKVRKNWEEKFKGSFKEYDRGFENTLFEIQKESDKEVSCDYEEECMCLKKELDRLTKEYKRECWLSSNHATDIMKMNEEMKQKDNKLAEYKAKLEMVELIFGGE